MDQASNLTNLSACAYKLDPSRSCPPPESVDQPKEHVLATMRVAQQQCALQRQGIAVVRRPDVVLVHAADAHAPGVVWQGFHGASIPDANTKAFIRSICSSISALIASNIGFASMSIWLSYAGI